MDIVLQRETTDEPFGLEVGRVEGKLFIQEVKTESWLSEEGSEEGKYIEQYFFFSSNGFVLLQAYHKPHFTDKTGAKMAEPEPVVRNVIATEAP